MSKRLITLLTAIAVVAALTLVAAMLASASGKATPRSTVAAAHSLTSADTEQPRAEVADNEPTGAPETAADTAAQAAVCTAAHVDPNGDNVQYDDVAGTCTG